jgi:hypothetical protein
MNNNELAKQLTTVIAQTLYNYEKHLLHEHIDAEDLLTGWREKYNPPRPKAFATTLQYNIFKNIVDAAVANIMCSMQDED